MSQFEESASSFVLEFRGMKLKFTKTQTVEKNIDAAGGNLNWKSFSLTVPPDAVLGNAIRIGFTLYEYQRKESEGIGENHITDLVALHPCGQPFAKEVNVSFNVEHPLLPEELNAFLLYEERNENFFVSSAVGECKSRVYGEMKAVLRQSSLDIMTKHFCKLFCIFGCVGHCYRALAYGRWAKGALKSPATIDLFFTSSQQSHIDYVKRNNSGMPVLEDTNVTVYFSKAGVNTLDVEEISDGWKIGSPKNVSIENQELKQAERNKEQFCKRSFRLEKAKGATDNFLLTIHFTNEVKRTKYRYTLSLSEYPTDHVSTDLESNMSLVNVVGFLERSFAGVFSWRGSVEAPFFSQLLCTDCFRA